MIISIAQLKDGQDAKVISVCGGINCRRRLESLGLREGTHIKKIKGLFNHGPVIIKAGHTQIALGKGLAQKVMVELLEKNELI
ncbi:MAG: ferrous iron transport protein A [Candidatus Omnitrophica bacterium]|nr:ferrous iron transport protein A [Candidatus Omnitrophota bacterium]